MTNFDSDALGLHDFIIGISMVVINREKARVDICAEIIGGGVIGRDGVFVRNKTAIVSLNGTQGNTSA